MNSIELYAKPGSIVYSFSDSTNTVREWTIIKVILYIDDIVYHVRDNRLNYLTYCEPEFKKLFFHSKTEAVSATEKTP